MKEKLEKLKSLLQGDSDPKWTALIAVLEAIIDKSYTDNFIGKKLNHISDAFDKTFDKFDKVFDGIKDRFKW